MSGSTERIGLALSGGGYRATAFHLGTLKKLSELDILSRVEVLSTISGGSITGACYGLHQGTFDSFYEELYHSVQQKNVITKILFSWMGLRFLLLLLCALGSGYFLFTSYAWIFPVVIVVLLFFVLKFQFILFPISKRIEEVYDDFFYKKKTLGHLNEKPVLVIGSTNLQTARPFSFSRERMQDSTYQYMHPAILFKQGEFPVSRAVMASSCVPFAFTPILIDKKFFVEPEDAKRVHPVLVDGGVYDNQGIHKIMQSGRYACNVVITSDAGTGSQGEGKFRNTFTLLLETVNVFMSRIKKAQMVKDVYENASTSNKQIAYFSLAWDVENCIKGFIRNLASNQVTQAVIEKHKLPAEWVAAPLQYEKELTAWLEERTGYNAIAKPSADEKKVARSVGTNLTTLRKKQVDALIKQAEALTELQVKLYCPSLIK